MSPPTDTSSPPSFSVDPVFFLRPNSGNPIDGGTPGGIEFGWVKASDCNSLDAIFRHDAETAGGFVSATRNGLWAPLAPRPGCPGVPSPLKNRTDIAIGACTFSRARP